MRRIYHVVNPFLTDGIPWDGIQKWLRNAKQSVPQRNHRYSLFPNCQYSTVHAVGYSGTASTPVFLNAFSNFAFSSSSLSTTR